MMDNDTALHDAALDPSDILIAEYNYVAQTAFQANEDRSRVSSYYFVTVGAAVAATVGIKPDGISLFGFYMGFSAVFGVLGFVGVITLLQLARLRAMWTESAKAMCNIKEYYNRMCPTAKLETAILWTRQTIPALNKRWSVAFLMAVSVVLIDSVMVGASVTYALFAFNIDPSGYSWLIALVIGIALFVVGQCRLYVIALRAR